MSLVGTRPPTVDEWEKYELHHRSRMSTKPGITGMWQVSGRSDITDFEEVVRLDTEYIEHWTILKYLNENIDDIKGDYICVSNVHTTVTSYEDASYCAVQNGGLMAIPDGGPLSTVGQKRGYKNMSRTTGPGLMGEVFKISAERQVFFIESNDIKNSIWVFM